MVCQAISIAMTVVLPAPVASLSARRSSPGLASSAAFSRCSRNHRLPAGPDRGAATSVNQMAVSTASTWQKKGRMSLNLWCRQCRSSRAVSGVTRHWSGRGRVRHRSTSRRTSLTIVAWAYCWACVESPLPSSNANPACSGTPVRLLGFGIGVMNSARRRDATSLPVGWPLSSSSQCREG